MAQAVLTAPNGLLTTTELRAAAGGASEDQTEALSRLKDDDRVENTRRRVATRDGKSREASIWDPGGEAASDSAGVGMKCLSPEALGTPFNPCSPIRGRRGSGVERYPAGQPIRSSAQGLRMAYMGWR
jgi:hypothetical protein